MARRLAFQLLLAAATLLAAEGALRLAGFHPLTPNDYRLESTPSFFLALHPHRGFALRPGEFTVRIRPEVEGGLTFHPRHLPDSTRYTPGAPPPGDSLPTIRVYGCSFSYGMGVEDRAAWPARLQQTPGTSSRVENRAVPGHGTVQAWQDLRADPPGAGDLVIVAYSALMHDPRNAMTRAQRRLWTEAFQTPEGQAADLLARARFPFVREGNGRNVEDGLHIDYLPMDALGRPWPGAHRSALVHLAETAAGNLTDRPAEAAAVSLGLLLDMNRIASRQGARLFVAGITNDPPTANRLRALRERGVDVADLSVDLAEPAYNLLPQDGHPSPAAHAVYAERIADALRAVTR